MARFSWRHLIGLYGPDTSRGSTGLGADFPQSSGERERGKHRPSKYHRLNTIAVVNDDGEDITAETNELLRSLLAETRRLRRGLMMSGVSEEVDEVPV